MCSMDGLWSDLLMFDFKGGGLYFSGVTELAFFMTGISRFNEKKYGIPVF